MKKPIVPVLLLVLVSGCDRGGRQQAGSGETQSLTEARKGFQSKVVQGKGAKEAAPEPPAELFRKVQYEAPVGKLTAYISPDPKDGKKHPAIIWITGGDSNSIDEGCWTEGPPNNDQSASPIRKSGVVMMFPSLRGGNDNPGSKEGFLGEVDDVLAAADYLAKLEFVDPNRIYLGGHSTGGTLALLVAESSPRFRAVFSFGPVDDVVGYPAQFLPFNTSNRREMELRSPGRWLHSVQSPVFVIEGESGNADCVRNMMRGPANPKVRFFLVKGADHFNILGPVNRLIAAKIKSDDGASTNLTFTEQELNKLFSR